MKYKGLIIALALISCPTVSSAEFYKYRDASGVLRYTDDVSEIPKDKRQKLDAYRSAEDFRLPQQKPQKSEYEIRRELRKTKTALDEEYQELLEAKKALDAARKTSVKSTVGAEAYNEKLLQLNKRITDFEKSRRKIRTKSKYKKLQKEQKELTRAKKALDEERRKSKRNAAATRAHNEKVSQLNQRITDFEKRRQALRKKIDTFNASKLGSSKPD